MFMSVYSAVLLHTRRYFNKFITVGVGAVTAAALLMPAAVHATSPSTRFTDPNPQSGDEFGYALSLSSDGTVAVVGSPESTINGIQTGTAYVFTNTDGTWTEAAQLAPTDGTQNGSFGGAVTISPDGQTIIVGASGSGSAYIYTEPSETDWSGTLTQQSELQESAGQAQAGDLFGWSVALSADDSTAIVGARFHNVNAETSAGAACIFTQQNGDWSSTPTLNETTDLTVHGPTSNSDLGWSVALSANGSTALVGAPAIQTTMGDAYTYSEPAGGWSSTSVITETQEISPSDGSAGDLFGLSVALSGDGNTAAVGGPGLTINSQFATGAAYVFTNSGSGLTQTFETIATPEGAFEDEDGWSVALAPDGSSLLIGSQGHMVNGNAFEGIAYGFTPNNDGTGNWTLSNTYTPSSDGPNQQFGFSVALVNNMAEGNAFIGAPGAAPPSGDSANSNALKAMGLAKPDGSGSNPSGGTAYLFDTSPPAISNINPGTAGIGAEVAIKGFHLEGATSVSFNGVNATIATDTSTEVDVAVPSGIPTNQSVPVTVVTPYGSANSSFSVYPVPPPTIASFNPTSTGEGDSVTIKGSGLLGATVSLNGHQLAITKNNKATISVTIPLNALSGYLVVTNPASPSSGSSQTSSPLTVLAPSISKIPKSGSVGSTITIKGQDLGGVTKVQFNGGPAVTPTSAADKAVTVVIPSGATSGHITVTAISGTSVSAKSLTIN